MISFASLGSFVPGIAQAIGNWPISQYVAESSWAFPTIESIHVISIVTVIGTILIMDLRLLGVASTSCAVTEMSRDTLKWTWGAFVLAFITGTLLFMSKASDYSVNPFFFWKLVMVVVAGANMAIFHVFTWRTVKDWDCDCQVPTGGKIAGGLSLFFWIVVAFLGRAIGFTLDKFANS